MLSRMISPSHSLNTNACESIAITGEAYRPVHLERKIAKATKSLAAISRLSIVAKEIPEVVRPRRTVH